MKTKTKILIGVGISALIIIMLIIMRKGVSSSGSSGSPPVYHGAVTKVALYE
jgi:hypothetical protein